MWAFVVTGEKVGQIAFFFYFLFDAHLQPGCLRVGSEIKGPSLFFYKVTTKKHIC